MTEPLTVPEWVCTLVGRLVLDNEALRRELAERDREFPDVAPDADASQ